MNMEVNYPAFFSVFDPEVLNDKLEIPSAFVRSIQEALPQNVVLRDRYGNSWPVKVMKVGNLCYFIYGWEKFRADNLVKKWDFLVFNYPCEGVFHVKIFGPSACEEKGCGGPKSSISENHFAMEEEEEEEEDTDAFEEESSVKNYTHLEQEDYEQDDDQVEQVTHSEAASNEEPRRRRRTTDWFVPEIFSSGLLPPPKNHYFVTRARPKRSHELYIPVHLLKNLNLDFPPTMAMVDPRGRSFSGKRNVWRNGQTNYVGEWKDLLKANRVGPEDLIVCEFKRGAKGETYLGVSFVRG